jgi:hypothetical protein
MINGSILNQAHARQKSPHPPFFKEEQGGILEVSDTSRCHLIFVVLYNQRIDCIKGVFQRILIGYFDGRKIFKTRLSEKEDAMKRDQSTLYAGMEAGGTKFVCLVAAGPDDVRARISFPTTKPEETLGRAVSFFKAQEPFAALGIGTFGPCDLNPESPTYGRLSTSIKPGWKDADVRGAFRRAFDVPVGIDTDVNVAALGEYSWGAGQGLDMVLYLTVGTGIGGGGVINGRMMHGLFHPEMGHIRVPRGPMATGSRAFAPTTAIACRVWLRARPSKPAGGSRRLNSLRGIPPGRWKLTTWLWRSTITSAPFPPTGSSWAEG